MLFIIFIFLNPTKYFSPLLSHLSPCQRERKILTTVLFLKAVMPH